MTLASKKKHPSVFPNKVTVPLPALEKWPQTPPMYSHARLPNRKTIPCRSLAPFPLNVLCFFFQIEKTTLWCGGDLTTPCRGREERSLDPMKKPSPLFKKRTPFDRLKPSSSHKATLMHQIRKLWPSSVHARLINQKPIPCTNPHSVLLVPR